MTACAVLTIARTTLGLDKVEADELTREESDKFSPEEKESRHYNILDSLAHGGYTC